MSSDIGPTEPVPTGRHGLGPHVVGQRIVVRRLLEGETGPSGGPAMTDLLGVCREWTATHCVVESAEGTVAVPRRLIVSGKPVPPRPSVHRRLSRAEVEARVGSATPPGQTMLLASVARLARSLPHDLDSAPEDSGASAAPPPSVASLRDDWLGLHDLDDLAGLVTAVSWGAERGATTVWLRTPEPRWLEHGFAVHH